MTQLTQIVNTMWVDHESKQIGNLRYLDFPAGIFT